MRKFLSAPVILALAALSVVSTSRISAAQAQGAP